MKRIIVACMMVVIFIAGCGSEENNQIISENVSVEIFTEDKNYAITLEKEQVPDVIIGSKARIKITSNGSKIASVTQDAYFDKDGYLLNEDVEFCFSKLPDNFCSYEMYIPKGKTFETRVILENNDEYYFTLTRE